MRWTKLLMALFTFGLLGWSAGCASSYGHNGDERAHMYRSVFVRELDMMNDDVDHFLMVERRTRLSRWH
ncbi:MAG: hypothetical protein HJJLKODD_02322 [Phycisphaerae bacterium]|nr:hypothetical protein [Phycisphaerae bacterium]